VPSGHVKFEDNKGAVHYEGWYGFTQSGTSGGTFRDVIAANNRVTFKFKATGIKWVSRKGPDQGQARVTIDGVDKGIFDLYNPTTQMKAVVSFTGLPNVLHTLVITSLGTKNASSSGTQVVVDSFIVGSTTTQETSPKVQYNSWFGANSSSASGGSYHYSNTAGASVGYTFNGTQVKWTTAKGKNYGQAQVFIDGVDKGVVDLYNAAQKWKFVFTYAGLSSGIHTIEIHVLGLKSPSATDTRVVVDAFESFP
jgi:hypothetical protein